MKINRADFHIIDLNNFNLASRSTINALLATPGLVLDPANHTVKPTSKLADLWADLPEQRNFYQLLSNSEYDQFLIQLKSAEQYFPLPEPGENFRQLELYDALTFRLDLHDHLRTLIIPVTTTDMPYQFFLNINLGQQLLSDQQLIPTTIETEDTAAMLALVDAEVRLRNRHLNESVATIDDILMADKINFNALVGIKMMTGAENDIRPTDPDWTFIARHNQETATKQVGLTEFLTHFIFKADTLARLIQQIELNTNYRFCEQAGVYVFNVPGDLDLFNAIRNQAVIAHRELTPATELDQDFLTAVKADLDAKYVQNIAVTPTETHQYTVVRKMAGATLAERPDAYFNEELTRQFDLHDGDLVELRQWDQGYERDYPRIMNVTPQNQPDPFERFEYGVVEETDIVGTWQIQQDYQGHLLKLNDVPTPYMIDSYYNQLPIEPGSLVTLTYPKNATNFDLARITWIHHEDTPMTRAPQPSIAKTGNQGKNFKAATYQNKIDYDLDGRKVLVIGYSVGFDDIKPAITNHGGIAITYEGTIGQSVRLARDIRRADYVLIMKSYASHEITQPAIELIKQFKKPFASTSGLSAIGVEQALYRIVNGLPSSEEGSKNIEYPEAKND